MYASRQRAPRTISTLCWVFLYGKLAWGKSSYHPVNRRESATSQQGHVRMRKEIQGYEKFTGVCSSILSVVFFPRVFRHFSKFVPIRARSFSCHRHSLVQQQAKGHDSGPGEISISVLTFGKWYNLSKNPKTLKLSVNKDGFFS